jgi:predicted ribonuclease YlaK
MKAYNITVASKGTKAAELKAQLEQHLDPDRAEIALEVRDRKSAVRVIDPTILVAIVGAAGTGLGALIAGLMEIAKQKSSRLIIIQSKGGTRLEVPVGVSEEELEALIENVKELELEDTKILLP